MGNGTRPTYHCVHGRPTKLTRPRYIFIYFFPHLEGPGWAGEVSGEHEDELIGEERRDAAKSSRKEGHITRDRRRAGINVDGDVDRR